MSNLICQFIYLLKFSGTGNKGLLHAVPSIIKFPLSKKRFYVKIKQN